MRALVIGADGFAGRWLLRHLLESGDEAVAAVGPGYAGAPLPAGLEPVRMDVRDVGQVRDVLVGARPQVIFYLAGVSRAGSRENVGLALGVSVHGALNVLEAAGALGGPVRLVHVGSSHMYADPPDETPIDEGWPVRPASVYGAAKAAGESALLHLAPRMDVEMVAIRAFNHIGPGQGSGFVVPSLAEQVLRIERGTQEPVVNVGNLDARRDFTDVRDVVRAYRLAALHGRPGTVYNVASGSATSIRQVLDLLLELKSVRASVEVDPTLARAGESVHAMVGDAGRLAALTGWHPEISLATSLADVLGDAIPAMHRRPS